MIKKCHIAIVKMSAIVACLSLKYSSGRLCPYCDLFKQEWSQIVSSPVDVLFKEYVMNDGGLLPEPLLPLCEFGASWYPRVVMFSRLEYEKAFKLGNGVTDEVRDSSVKPFYYSYNASLSNPNGFQPNLDGEMEARPILEWIEKTLDEIKAHDKNQIERNSRSTTRSSSPTINGRIHRSGDRFVPRD